jgi:hypothetical protein
VHIYNFVCSCMMLAISQEVRPYCCGDPLHYDGSITWALHRQLSSGAFDSVAVLNGGADLDCKQQWGSYFVPLTTLPPSPSPTTLPTHFPTSKPSMSPTLHPTKYPTHMPTSYPTFRPTSEPSFLPTYSPSTSAPTPGPTLSPSALPTIVPTPPPTPTCVKYVVQMWGADGKCGTQYLLSIQLFMYHFFSKFYI